MLKTSVDHKATPATVFIVYGGLKGYVKSPTRANVKEIIESSDEKYHFRVKSCLHRGLFKRLGVPELTRIMCNTDNALYNIYCPDIVLFHRNGPGNTIFEGNDYCEFVCENQSQ